MKGIVEAFVVAILIGAAFVWGKYEGKRLPEERLRVDTVFFRDTIRDTLLLPQ